MSANPFTLCAVLDLVVGEQRPWNVDELARVTDDFAGAVEAADELVEAGLAERLTDDAVRAARSARYISFPDSIGAVT